MNPRNQRQMMTPRTIRRIWREGRVSVPGWTYTYDDDGNCSAIAMQCRHASRVRRFLPHEREAARGDPRPVERWALREMRGIAAEFGCHCFTYDGMLADHAQHAAMMLIRPYDWPEA